VRRLISQTSFVLKGSGWYADLYSSNKGKSEGDAKDAGGDAKPAADSAPSTASDAGDAKTTPASKDSSSPDPGGKGKGSGKGKKKSAAKAAA
jgi:hypothetical protein